MTEVYEEEKNSIATKRSGRDNLMTSLVRASIKDADAQERFESDSQMLMSLIEFEIYVNIFMFKFADHDKVSIKLHFALLMLAASSAIQSWLSEEIKYVMGTQSPEEWDYRANFLRLKRCLAVMLYLLQTLSSVTIRILALPQYETVFPIARSTGQQPRVLEVEKRP
jgi:hypothetical protein